MMFFSFRSIARPPTPQVNRAMLVFVVALGLFSVGCSESEKEPQTEVQEKSPPPVQEAPPIQEASPTQESVETSPVSGTEPARQEVEEQLNTANKAVDKAGQLLKQAPRGKGSDLAISALNQEVDAAQTLLQTGQTHFLDQQYSMAKDKAQEAEEKANTVIQQVEQALDTVKLHSP